MNKRYPAYKPSGIEWIGEIPDSWIVNKFARIAFFQEGPGLRNWQFKEKGVRVICVTNITEEGINFDLLERYISEEEYEASYKHFTVQKGDYLLSSSGASWGKVAEYTGHETVILNTSTIRFNSANTEKFSKDFCKWLIKSTYVKEQLNVLLTGSCQPNFGPSHLSQLIVVYPKNQHEQKVIANYLNQKTELINEAIQKKRGLIELLQEERTALINQAVTRGLNPDIPLKPSGVEWLGDVPDHWVIKKLKHLTEKIGSGITPKGGAEVYQTSGIPLLRSQNIHFNGLRLDDVAYISADVHNSMSGSRVVEGDVLLNITGASIGRCYYVDAWLGEANVNQHVCIMRPNKAILTKYMYFFLASWLGQTQIDRLQNGANREGLNYDQLRNFFCPLPDVEEQAEIIANLEHRLMQLENVRLRISTEIKLLQEYRTALINEVVTGKRWVVDEDLTIKDTKHIKLTAQKAEAL